MEKERKPIKQNQSGFTLWARAFAVALLWLGACGYCFFYTGHTLLQLSVCFVAAAGLAALLYAFDHSGFSVGLAQLLFVCLWLACALSRQFKLQIEQGWPGYWIYCFYFDSLLTQGTVWLCSTLVVTVWRLFDRPLDRRRFFRLSSAAFVLFYLFLLVYSFYLSRMNSAQNYPLNLDLLSTVQMYLNKIGENPYEMWMMIFGNLFYFTPLGYIFAVALRQRSRAYRAVVLLLFAPVAFFFLEYSQYMFQIGYCEIDDMVMNALGFWLGAALAPLSDRFARRVSKQRITYFWM